MNGLILHCGAKAIDRHALETLPEPKPLGPRHRPIHHADYVESVEMALDAFNLEIVESAFGLNNDGADLFGAMQVRGRALHRADDYDFAIGLRGGNSQRMAHDLSGGSYVFVCDNMSFNGQVVMRTKATTAVLDRLSTMVHDLVRRVIDMSKPLQIQFDAYKTTRLPDLRADAAMTEMVRREIIKPTDHARVMREWDQPSYDDFAEDRNVWRLFNAVTETMKPRTENAVQLPSLAPRTIKLHQLCDQLADLPQAA